jgi:hypothetical protein
MNKLKVLLTLLFGGFISMLSAQLNNPGYLSVNHYLQGIGTSSGNILPGTSTISFSSAEINKAYTSAILLRERNKSAKLLLKLDFGNDYVAVPSAAFSIDLGLIITIGSTVYTRTLTVTERTPEVLQTVDLLGSIPSATGITIQVASPLGIPSSSGLLLNYINHSLRFSAQLLREYDVDVRLASSLLISDEPIAANPVIPASSRLVTFSWTPNAVDEYPNYELQILKLYNTDELLKDDPNQIRTTIDWSSALKVETQSAAHSIKLTMAEGSGYYIWRVRPVGTYFNGGIANSENYGKWSYSSADNSQETFNKNVLTAAGNPTRYAFYFDDPDENINWIYNRTFTEGDNNNQGNATGIKMNEGMNYADGLLRARQSQSYNSSNNTTLVSQTVSDYSGRPALTTLPVPVNSGLNGYKINFVQNNTATHDLYTAADFDADANANAPSTIYDAPTSAFSYYSNAPVTLNPDADNKNVPNAEGYAFTRTKFKSDGTGRVEEESGAGSIHSLGTLTNGSVRTTRILYGTPSDDELIRIFGEEAPLAESVIKTTTIDPNNVVSVSYTSKEGKTIATALISEQSDNLDTVRSVSLFPVSNVADQNTLSNGRFISSRRINIPSNATSIGLSYTLGTLNSPGGCPSASCNFKLNFLMVDVKTGKTFKSDADNSVPGYQSFNSTSGPLTFPANWEFRAEDDATVISHISSDNHKILMDAGEYMFIKEVYSDNGNDYAADLARDQSALYEPILTAISTKMIEANTPAKYLLFISFMNTLAGDIASYNSSGPVTTADLLTSLGLTAGSGPADDVPATYIFPHEFVLAPIPLTQGPTTAMSFQTGCCGPMSVPIPKPDICYTCDGTPEIVSPATLSDDMITANATALSNNEEVLYGVNDIFSASDFSSLSTDAARRAKIDVLVQHYFIDLLKDKMDEEEIPQSQLYQIAPGFSFESLKFMISNMLLSRYYTRNAVDSAGSWYTAFKTSSGVWHATDTLVSSLLPTLPHNYSCEKLLTCWTDAVNLLNSFSNSDDVNIVDEFNNQDGANSAQDEGEDDDNYEEMSKRQKKKLKRKIGDELKEFSDSDDGKVPKSKIEAMTSLVANFMDCAGQQFAAVIDGETLPGYIASADGITPDDYSQATPASACCISGLEPCCAPAVATVAVTLGGSTYYPPVLMESWSPAAAHMNDCDGTSVKALAYPYIVKPEWMFKYFVYNVWHNNSTSSSEYIDDKDAIIPNQVLVDLRQGYNDGTYYLASALLSPTGPLCNYTFDPDHLHVNWSKDDRMQFYAEIKGAAACYTKKGYTATELSTPVVITPGCDKCDLINQANSELDAYMAACTDKAPGIKAALIASLEAACYKIVECQRTSVPGEVTEREIDIMVDSVVSKAHQQIFVIRDKLPVLSGTTCSSGVSPYGCALTDYPVFQETECSEILLENTDELVLNDNTSIVIKLFPDCDQELLTMLSNGTFLPYIAPNPDAVPPCAAIPKEWNPLTAGCTAAPCNGEQTDCTGVDAHFSTYSAEQTIPATTGP